MKILQLIFCWINRSLTRTLRTFLGASNFSYRLCMRLYLRYLLLSNEIWYCTVWFRFCMFKYRCFLFICSVFLSILNTHIIFFWCWLLSAHPMIFLALKIFQDILRTFKLRLIWILLICFINCGLILFINFKRLIWNLINIGMNMLQLIF